MIECVGAAPSLHELNTYCVPAVPACVVTTASVWVPGARLKVCGAVCTAPPSTVNCSPAGLVRIVIPVCGTKLAVTVLAALMVTVVAVLLDAATGPLQLLNWYPLLAVAVRFTTVPAL